MASDHRSSAEIEREIVEERNALTSTLDEIQDRLSFEALSNNMVGSLREHSGDIAHSMSRAVKENPVPLALTAIGLAWLAISSNRSSSGGGYDRDELRYSTTRRPRSGSLEYGRYEPEDYRRDPATYGSAGGSASTTGGYTRSTQPDYPRPVYDAGGRPISSHDYDEGDPDSRWDKAKSTVSGAAQSASDKLQSGRDAASAHTSSAAQGTSDAMHRGGEAVSGAAHSAGSAASDAAHQAQSGLHGAAARARHGYDRLAEGARRRGQGAYASAAELRERITHGTRDMSEHARARVLAARTRAYEAQLRAEHLTARGRDKAMDLYEDQPVLGGIIAMALGAAIGAALPRTRQEDDAFGAYRDDLFEDAERVYREEREKLVAVAKSTADEAKHIARDAAQDIKSDAKQSLSEAEAKAKDAAQQVADTAKAEADKKNLGQRS